VTINMGDNKSIKTEYIIYRITHEYRIFKAPVTTRDTLQLHCSIVEHNINKVQQYCN
jgi:hypothetical protein